MVRGILLDENYDLKIANKKLQLGNPLMQEVAIIFKMNQGELKIDPLIGANLIVNMRGVERKQKIESLLESQLDLDGKVYDDIKELITQRIN